MACGEPSMNIDHIKALTSMVYGLNVLTTKSGDKVNVSTGGTLIQDIGPRSMNLRNTDRKRRPNTEPTALTLKVRCSS